MMIKKADVLIIGAGPAGMVSAITARRYYPDKKILVLKDVTNGCIPCGMSAGEMINVIGMAIQQRVSLTELETLQMATHPYLTSAPTMYPIVLAAQDALGRL